MHGCGAHWPDWSVSNKNECSTYLLSRQYLFFIKGGHKAFLLIEKKMIRLFPQGWEQIPYDSADHAIVDYYLMAMLEGDTVIGTIAFGYMAEYNLYMELEEEDRLAQLRTLQEVDDYVVASFRAPQREQIVPMDHVLPAPYKEVWLDWHRTHYVLIDA